VQVVVIYLPQAAAAMQTDAVVASCAVPLRTASRW
jgi:hypothetical protein